jgi:signal transduction histidine kinase
MRDEVDRVAAGLAVSLEGKTLDVRGHASCHADPLRVRQIVRNLLSNAVRYGGTTITVHLDSSDGRGRVVVADDGDGIPADAVDSIFETYTRAHSSAVRPGSVGIGLAVSRRLARLMGGDVVYEPGPPTAFVLTLPASSPVRTTSAARPPQPVGSAGPQPN